MIRVAAILLCMHLTMKNTLDLMIQKSIITHHNLTVLMLYFIEFWQVLLLSGYII